VETQQRVDDEIRIDLDLCRAPAGLPERGSAAGGAANVMIGETGARR
jgi:hypothetical protein